MKRIENAQIWNLYFIDTFINLSVQAENCKIRFLNESGLLPFAWLLSRDNCACFIISIFEILYIAKFVIVTKMHTSPIHESLLENSANFQLWSIWSRPCIRGVKIRERPMIIAPNQCVTRSLFNPNSQSTHLHPWYAYTCPLYRYFFSRYILNKILFFGKFQVKIITSLFKMWS